jgi:ATP-dependent DNA helicase UvrD/PcrA
VEATREQRAIRDEASLALRILAPAGCGKTEALALRVLGLLERKQIQAPQRMLVLTFSNRARDNASDRLASHLGPRSLRSMVTVSNLHGFAGRVVKAHGEVIGLDSDLELPASDWISEQCRIRELSYRQADAAKRALRVAKQQALTDAEVLASLSKGANDDAFAIERLRQDERVLTYDDLLRLAELTLQYDPVAELYRCHFGCVVVDEFQDLTSQQLRVIQRVGYGRTTYAGDVAQGIYSFAGADPETVLAAICDETSLELPLTESYRSSPAVLAAVNALNARTGGEELRCAEPASWPGGGIATGTAFQAVDHEASWVVDLARRILEGSSTQRIGVIARSGSRRRFVDEAISNSELPWRRWDDPLMDTATCAHMRKLVGRVDVGEFHADGGGLAYLLEQADIGGLEEPDTRIAVVEAVGWMADTLNDGTPLDEIAHRIRATQSSKLLDAPGVHLLSGHLGKGQQFDWVVVVGLEEGILPNFNATTSEQLREEARVFSVMLSRARHGVAVTRCVQVPTLAGAVQTRDPSQFLRELREAKVLVPPAAVEAWLASADWAAIEAR